MGFRSEYARIQRHYAHGYGVFKERAHDAYAYFRNKLASILE